MLLYNLLPRGDIVIKKDDDETICIIERKTLTDLMASIKDGRYTEQSFRLSNASNVPNHNIIYLIEGNINSIVNPIEKKTIYTSLTSINLFKGFSLTRTQNVKESADYLLSMGIDPDSIVSVTEMSDYRIIIGSNIISPFQRIKIDILEIHNRPSYIKKIFEINKNIILYFHNDPLSQKGAISKNDRIKLLNNTKVSISSITSLDHHYGNANYFPSHDVRTFEVNNTPLLYQIL